jgi:hypothetical protein
MIRVADERSVLVVGDGIDADTELIQVHPMGRPLVLFTLLGPHRELPGGDPGDLRVYRVAHLQDEFSIGGKPAAGYGLQASGPD